MKSQPIVQNISCGLLLIVSSNFIHLPPLVAQSITAAPNGTGTVIQHNGNTYYIEGGTQAGANLFHSFQEFGLSRGEIANFLSNPSVINILGRVTGGNTSIIDGLIQANPNLYLMNPAGMVFGPHASLNVGGDFYVTTADRIGFEGGWFSAIGANDYTTLVGTPNQFAFLSEHPNAILNQGKLQAEGNLSLIGGTVQSQGAIISTSGNVTLAAVPGTRLVNLGQPGMLLSLDLPATALKQGISPLDLPRLLTGSGRGNSPVVAPNPTEDNRALPLQNPNNRSAGILPAYINQGDVDISGTVQGEQVDLYASGQVTPSDPDLIQGDTRVIRFSATGENPDQAVFIDARADQPDDLLYGAVAGTVAQIIERDEDGVEVITEQLAAISESVGELESVAIVAEGNEGNFWLGNQWIRSENIADYQQQLQTWGEALTENADLLLYSCFTALGATGEALIASLADMTGADVAASTNATGSANYGADWHLERRTGTIESANPFDNATLATWDGKLMTHTVTSNADAGANTLRNILVFGGAAGLGDTIVFNLAGSSTITLSSGPISFGPSAANITIDGSNVGGAQVVIDGNDDGIFQTSLFANNLTLQNITLQNATRAGGNGGAISHFSVGTLALDNVTLNNNSASGDGGAIHSLGGVQVINSTITGNSSGGNGGAIYSQGFAGAPVVIDNSTLSGNSASGDGGAIAVRNGTITVTNGSTISSNTAVNDGGGLYASSDITVTNSTISNNSSGRFGGGIRTIGLVTLTGSTATGNVADNDGGGIFGQSDVTLTNSTVSNNTSNDHGGGIYAPGNITLTNSTLSGNSAAGDGGGMDVDGNVTVINSTILGNMAGLSGGGVYTATGQIDISNSSTVSNNIATNNGGGLITTSGNVNLADSTVTGNSAGGNGGGVQVLGGDITLNNATVSNNASGLYAGGVQASGNITVNSSNISGNSTGQDGGGIDGSSGFSIITINHSMILGNSAGRSGGGIEGSGSGDITLINSVVSGNSATNNGGGFQNIGNVTLNHSTIANNTALSNGGGFFSGNTVTATYSTLSNNSSGISGGGFYSGGDVGLSFSTIALNTAALSGGGIYSAGNVSADNATVSSNISNGNGGGIYLGGAANLLNATIAFNTADADNNGTGDGGGLFSNGVSSHQITNTIIANNADSGGQSPDVAANLGSSIVRHSLIQNTAGITGATLSTGANGNIIGQDPVLGALANNGGTTQTHTLLPGSPAINAGDNGAVLTTLDQRGAVRIFDGTVDIGATEFGSPIVATSGTAPNVNVFPLDYEPLTPLDALSLLDLTELNRNRVEQLLAQDRFCEAVATLDQLHTQNFNDHFERFESREPMTCAEMQQRLPDDAALLYTFAQTDKLHLITLRSDDEPTHYEFPLPRTEILTQVAQFQQTVTNPILRRSDSFLQPAQQLHQWLVEPLLEEFQTHEIRKILFGLDDGLRTLPIAALHDGKRFIIEDYQATLIPSMALTPTNRSRLQNATVTAMGVADFGQLAPLPAVPLELASIKQEFPTATPLLNHQATLANFHAQVEKTHDPLQTIPGQIVHLATHGTFRPGRAENSYIQFWDDQLNLKELGQVNWSDAAVELLVLSACQTALGDQSAEYGFAGLAVQAEVGAAIAGLWSANDAGTLALMNEFYRQLSLGQPKGEALRLAQLAMLNGAIRLENKWLGGVGKSIPLPPELQVLGDRTFWHPYYWSAFTLIGNPW